MGERGPAPKRSDQRRRRNEPEAPVDKAPGAPEVEESMSLEFKPQPVVDKDGNVQWLRFPPKAASVAAWLKGAAALLATEGDRRRAGVELQRPETAGGEEAGDVSWLSDARERLRSS